MAIPNVRDLLVVPGRLSFGGTAFTSDYPHSGTALGLTLGIAVKENTHYSAEEVVTAEEFGGEIVEAVQQAEGVVLSCTLTSWDAAALEAAFPNTAVGATTGFRVVTAPGTNRAGARLSARALTPLVFTPDDVDSQPMYVIWRAIPAIDEANELTMQLDEEMGIGLVFVGIRDSQGRLKSHGRRHDV